MKGFRPQPTPSGTPHTPAGARVYTELRRRILHGEAPAGSIINEVELAAALEVSRTPVREALRELLNEGLLDDGGPRRQAVVATVTPAIIREVLMMRTALETIAVREAATCSESIVTDHLQLIEIRMSRAARDNDTRAFLDGDDEFHLHIAQAAGLNLVHDVLRRLRAATRLALLAAPPSQGDLQRTLAEHRVIIEALEERDPERVDRAMTAHLASTLALSGTATT